MSLGMKKTSWFGVHIHKATTWLLSESLGFAEPIHQPSHPPCRDFPAPYITSLRAEFQPDAVQRRIIKPWQVPSGRRAVYHNTAKGYVQLHSHAALPHIVPPQKLAFGFRNLRSKSLTKRRYLMTLEWEQAVGTVPRIEISCNHRWYK